MRNGAKCTLITIQLSSISETRRETLRQNELLLELNSNSLAKKTLQSGFIYNRKNQLGSLPSSDYDNFIME